HVLHEIGGDFQIVRHSLVLHRDRVQGGQFRLAGHGNPQHYRRIDGSPPPSNISGENCGPHQPALSTVLAPSSGCGTKEPAEEAPSLPTPKCAFTRSSTSRRLRPRWISPNVATERSPVSSETTSERQSLSSVMPMAARCRVPRFAGTAGLGVNGGEQGGG